MSKLFTNKNFIQKTIVVIVIILLFNFVFSNISFGADGGIGGVLFEPIKDLTLALGDGVVWIIQKIIFGTDVSLLKMEHSSSNIPTIFGAIGGAIAGSIAIIVGVAGAPFTGGLSLSAVAAGISIIGTTVVAAGATYFVVSYITEKALPADLYMPMYAISPYEIFANKIGMLDVNFFNPNKYDSASTLIGESGKEQKSAARELQPTIAKWYVAIRNLAITIMIVMLIYVGIRIIISSSAEDRAKYKQRLMDWIIAMCLLFFMHYMMVLIMAITNPIVDAIDSSNKPYNIVIGTSENKLKDYRYNVVIPTTSGTSTDSKKENSKVFDTDADSLGKAFRDKGIIVDNTDGNGELFVWPTNLMGKARIELQLEPKDQMSDDDILARKFGYTIIFLALVIYTVLFLFRYLKRLLMLAFLTIIAPFVAMTYPLDKMKDGSAQAFNMWIKEYIFNILIQPVHLILYTILIGSAIDFAADNLLYALAALGFMLPAEKIMRKFFGFEQASTLAGGSALGGALAMQGINQLRKIGSGGSKKGGNGKDGNDTGKGKIKYNRSPDKGKDIGTLLDENNSSSPSFSNRASEGVPILGGGSSLAPGETMTSGGVILPAGVSDSRSSSGSGSSRNGSSAALPPTSAGKRTQWTQDDARGAGSYIKDSWNNSAAKRNLMAGSVGKSIRFVGNRINGTRSMASAKANAIKNGVGKQIKKIPKPIRNSARGAAAVLGSGVKYLAPRAAKLATRGTVAGAAGMAGIAAGLVSDDYSNVLKWGAAGAGAGWIAGGGIAQVPEKLGGASEGIKELGDKGDSIYTEASQGSKAEKERKKKVEDARAMKDKDRRKLYQSKLNLSKQELNGALEDAQKYRESGIIDDDLIIKTMKLDSREFGTERASKEKVILAGLADQVGGKRSDLKYIEKGLTEKGLRDADIQKYINGIKDINEWNA